MKLAVVIGTRPEAIKLAPVILESFKHKGIETSVIVTGQHCEMLYQMFQVFDIKPSVDLKIMRENQSLSDITTGALTGLSEVFARTNPDYIVVQGDTTTTFCGALAGFYRKIPVVHIEAGLRTFNKTEPFPEEANRCLTTHLSHLHFAPTELSRQNLLAEGVNSEMIETTGNTAIDALFHILDRNSDTDDSEASNNTTKGRTLLVTAHRRENHGERLKQICAAILTIVERFPDVNIVFPVHLSPTVREIIFPMLGDTPRISLVEPMDYLEFIQAMQRSYLILTDSGGVQEEAPSLGKPVLVLRDQTERPEATLAGTALLVGADYSRIVENASRLLSEDDYYKSMANIENPYGDGHSSERIIRRIKLDFAS